MSDFERNRQHWNAVGGVSYCDFWNVSVARKELSRKETEFVRSFIPKKRIRALDYGFGAGRFIKLLIESSASGSEVFGLDISDDMVDYCRRTFGQKGKVKGIERIRGISDLAVFNTKFDFITAIRCLKYNSDWEKYVRTLVGLLEPGGLMIFTMPKRYFFSGILKSRRLFRATPERVLNSIDGNQIQVIHKRGFGKIPDLAYGVQNRIWSRTVILGERVLDFFLGSARFDREIFYVLQKSF